jgi:uncharacterized protein
MADEESSNALLRGAGAVAIGAGVLALFPPLATTVSMTKVHMFTTTTGSRCGSAPAGVATIHQLGDGNPFAAEEETALATRNLKLYEAAVWLPITGDRREEGRAKDNWAWCGSLVGAYGATHHGRRQAALIVEDVARPRTPYRTRPRQAVRVLMRVDESSHTGTAPDAHRPITWWHEAGAGEARYTRHVPGESISDTLFTRWRLPGLRVAVRPIPSAPEDRLTPPNGPGGRLHSRDCGRRSPRSDRCDENCSPRWR